MSLLSLCAHILSFCLKPYVSFISYIFPSPQFHIFSFFPIPPLFLFSYFKFLSLKKKCTENENKHMCIYKIFYTINCSVKCTYFVIEL